MLGQELVRFFKSDKDYEVTAWDKSEIDITDNKQLEKSIFKLKPEIIINAAAYNAVDRCEKDKDEYASAKKINGIVPKNLAKISRQLDAVFIQYSSDYIFNGIPEIPEPTGCGGACAMCHLHEGFVPEIGFDEDAIPDPIQKYGKTKLMGEIAVQKNCENFYIIRTSKLFGKPAKSKDAKKSFFDTMLEIGKKQKEIRVVDEETSLFTYTPDLAKKTKEIIEAKKPFGIYHVANQGACTWYEAVVELYKMAKMKTKVVPVGSKEFSRPAKRPYVSTLLNTKLNPLRNYKLALREYLKKD